MKEAGLNLKLDSKNQDSTSYPYFINRRKPSFISLCFALENFRKLPSASPLGDHYKKASKRDERQELSAM